MKRVLILDDETIIVDSLVFILNQHSFVARGVYTHDSAIAAAREFHPDIFITGFNNCCEKNGGETAVEVQSFLPHCRVLIFSGQRVSDEVREQLARHGLEVLAKPVHPRDLIPKLQSIP